MTKTSPRIAPRKNKTYVRDLEGGVRLSAEVSPCVFMYKSYPLQITVSLLRREGDCLGDAHAVDRTKTAATYTDATVNRLLESIRVVPCRNCCTPAFDPSTIETNRNGLCEACFLSRLEAEWAAAEQAEKQELAARDSRMKRKGFGFRVTAWIHPEDGGDDYQVDRYFSVRPTPKQIGRLLRDEGSDCLDDYTIIAF